MRIFAKGGTDGANIVLFWPDNLPDDADAALKSDPITVVEHLRQEGKLIWFPCDGDGEYTVAVFVHSEIPPGLLAICMEEEAIPSLIVSGAGYFGGMEYIFKDDPSFLAKYPQMCDEVCIPEGTYSARVYSTEFVEGAEEAWLMGHAGATAVRHWNLHGMIGACAVIGVLATLLALCASWISWVVWLCLAAVASTLVAIAVLMSRTSWYKAVAKAQETFQAEYPDYVVHLD